MFQFYPSESDQFMLLESVSPIVAAKLCEYIVSFSTEV